MKRIKISVRTKDFFLIVIMISLLFGIYFSFSYGKIFDDYVLPSNDVKTFNYVLNPLWIDYMNQSVEEQEKYEIIPSQYILEYNSNSSNEITLYSSNEKFVKYDLRDEGFTTPVNNQLSSELCWSFATLQSFESVMLKKGLSSIDNPITFAERQLDYGTLSSVYVKEKYNPYTSSERASYQSGAYMKTGYEFIEHGVGPVTSSKFGSFTTSNNLNIKLNDVINVNNVEYISGGYAFYGSVLQSTSELNRENFIKDIKNHIIDYGEISFVSIGPSSQYAGSCYFNDGNNVVLDDVGNCNPLNRNNIHAMTIIGWDDKFNYSYCKYLNYSNGDVDNCKGTVRSGTGAFLVRNSWGDSTSYFYLTYDSTIQDVYGFTDVKEKNWTNNYDNTKSNVVYNTLSGGTVKYYKNDDREVLKKISFNTLFRNVNYYVYYSNNGIDYIELLNFYGNRAGNYVVDLNDINLDGKEFYIKVLSDSRDVVVNNIYAFTDYSLTDTESLSTIIVDKKIKNGSKLDLYTTTRNVLTGSSLSYRLFDDNNNDVSDKISVNNSYVINNQNVPNIVVNNLVDSKYYLKNLL